MFSSHISAQLEIVLAHWYSGIKDLGEPAVAEQVLDWLDAFITEEERDRIVAWHLGMSL